MCLTAVAPGTTSPSIAVVRKMRFPKTIGDECPRPGIAAFHLILLKLFQLVCRFCRAEPPWREGPLHWGQPGPANAPALFVTTSANRKRHTTDMNVRTIFFILNSSGPRRYRRYQSAPPFSGLLLLRFHFLRRRVAKCEKVGATSHNEETIRDRWSCHHHFTNRICCQQFVFWPSLHNKDLAIFT